MEDGTRVEQVQEKSREEVQLLQSGERMAQWFQYSHLPVKLQAVSRRFTLLALELIINLPTNPERTVALRKLLESKDCAVRCVLDQEGEAPRAGMVR